MRTPRSLLAFGLAALLFSPIFSTSVAWGEVPIEIRASPQVLVLSAVRAGDWLTVHTDLPYAEVDLDAPLTILGVEVDLAKPDSRGCLVAKIHLATLARGGVSLLPGLTIVVLEGSTWDEEPFSGSCTIAVRR